MPHSKTTNTPKNRGQDVHKEQREERRSPKTNTTPGTDPQATSTDGSTARDESRLAKTAKETQLIDLVEQDRTLSKNDSIVAEPDSSWGMLEQRSINELNTIYKAMDADYQEEKSAFASMEAKAGRFVVFGTGLSSILLAAMTTAGSSPINSVAFIPMGVLVLGATLTTTAAFGAIVVRTGPFVMPEADSLPIASEWDSEEGYLRRRITSRHDVRQALALVTKQKARWVRIAERLALLSLWGAVISTVVVTILMNL